MTLSIVAFDERCGHIGVAVASRYFAVGAAVPGIRGGVGAVASQAKVSGRAGELALARLTAGDAPQDVIDRLAAAVPALETRQIHMVDARGRIAAHTGRQCGAASGHVRGRNVSVAGNLLVGREVLVATLSVFEADTSLPLWQRLLAGMMAGEQAGGDRRGRQSASFVVRDRDDRTILDIRVDDHANPIEECRRLIGIWAATARSDGGCGQEPG